MDGRRRNIANILATGVLVTILLCTVLFWARWLCHAMRASLLPQSAREVTIYPSRNLKIPAAPALSASTVSGHPLFTDLGALHYLKTRVPGMPPGLSSNAHIYRWNCGPDGQQIHFDPSLGLIVCTGSEPVRERGGTHRVRSFTYYAGPEGLSTIADEKLGRFVSPIADTCQIQPLTVYDRALRRFFAINWRGNAPGVRKGPELPSDDRHRPVEIGMIWKNMVNIDVPGPDTLGTDNQLSQPAPWSIQHLGETMVLYASGHLAWLDPETLAIGGDAGYLTRPATLFASGWSAVRPEDVAAYRVAPLRRTGGKVRGTAVATLSRDGLVLRLDYFDNNGLQIKGGGAMAPYCDEDAGGRAVIKQIPTAKAAYFYLLGARGLTAAKFLLESLHPPILVLLSNVMGPSMEATAGYRSIFILPDSFIAMISRGDPGIMPWKRFFWALGCMLPGLLFLGLLSWRLERDGIRYGWSRNARTMWILGTITLDLPAYIAYRLTRRKASLVTCQNCAMGRRPDMERCHRCSSLWTVPELTPPAWRILGDEEPDEDSSPSQAEEVSSPAE